MKKLLLACCVALTATAFSETSSGLGVPGDGRPKLRTLDMVHHNPGEKPTKSKFLDPAFLAAMGSGAKVVNDFQAPQCACTFDELDPTIFPAGSESRKWVEDFTASCESRAKACHEAGLKCYYFMDIIVLPRELIRKYKDQICGPDGKVSFAREKTWEIHRLMLREMLRRIPSVDGFVIRTGEMYSHNVPYHGGNTPVNYRKDPEGFVKTHARLMNLLREEVCVKANREVLYRTWDFMCFHTRPDIYHAITDQVEPHPNLVMSVKHTCGDYLRYTTFNPTLGIGRHRQVVEFQCQREYEGKGAYPNYVVKGAVEGFEENRGVPGRQGLKDLLGTPQFAGVWTWSRGGGWEGPYLRNEFWCELNTYVMTAWARDPAAGEEAAFTKFMDAKKIEPASRAAFRKMALLSTDAVVRGLGNLPPESVKACWTRDHFIGDYDWLKTDYARLVSNDLVQVALANKREAVRLWEEIARLAETVKMADKADEHYLRTSAQYGLRLYRIYEAGWTVTLLGYQGDKTGVYDKQAIADGIRRYDEAWRDYRRLPVEATDCATLYDGWFAAYHISQDHNSIDPTPGMDAEVDRYRKIGKIPTGPWDVDVSDFPRQAGETGDSARILRAVAAAGKGGVVWFPRGEYEVDTMLVISNQTSLLLHKSAHLKAVREMPFVLKYFGRELENSGHIGGAADHNLFIKGGDIDGMGLANCAHVMGLRHFTMADTTCRNGRKVGLQLGDPNLPRSVEGGYEIVANNLYFICNLPGLAGNVGFLTYIGDAHFTDMVVVDYTVGIRDMKWSNRYTRCHIWGGIVKKAGTQDPEYLPNSIAFDLHGCDAVLTDCYADTAMIGYNVCADTRIFNCGYFNNWKFKMDNPAVFVHQGGSLIVTGGRFSKNSPHATLYKRGEKAGRLIWRDNQPLNFSEPEMKDLNDTLEKTGTVEKSSVNKANLAG